MVSVSIVIPFFGKVQDLVPLIKSLNKLNTKNIKVQTIIIDDNSKEKFNIIKKLSKFKIKLLFNKKNYGPAYSRNLGVKNSKSDFIWFLDHDVTLTNINFLQIGIKLIGINKYDAISGAKEMINKYPTALLPRIFPNFLGLYKIINTKNFIFERSQPDGCSIFLKKEVFLKKGFFNHKLRAYEEYEWSLRKFKLKILFRNDLMVVHKEKNMHQASFLIKYYENVINARIEVLKAHSPFRKKILFFLDTIFLPTMLFLLHVNKSHISSRYLAYGHIKNFGQLIKIFFLLFKSYFR